MSIETEIFANVTGDTAIHALVGTRVYPNLLPQEPTYPAIVYRRVSGERLHHLGGASGRAVPRFSFDCWGATYVEAHSVANALRTALDGFNGILSTIKASILIENEIDDYDSTVQKHRVIQDYFINHLET